MAPDYTLRIGMRNAAKLVGEDSASAYVARLNELREDAIRADRQERDRFRQVLLDEFGDAFDEYDLLHAAAVEAMEWANKHVGQMVEDDDSDDRDAMRAFVEVTKGVAARGVQTYGEIGCLLRGGYVRGAWSRFRTMQELYVALAVLATKGAPNGEHPELVERFLAHQDMFTPRIAEHLLAAGAPAETLDTSTLAILQQRRDRLLERYGREFKMMWGWAQPVVRPGARVGFEALLEALDESSLAWFYTNASEMVHAGSDGYHNHAMVMDDGVEVLPVGPATEGMALVANLASTYLLHMVELVVPAEIVTDNEADSNKNGALLLVGLAHVRDTLGDEFNLAEARIERRRLARRTESQDEDIDRSDP